MFRKKQQNFPSRSNYLNKSKNKIKTQIPNFDLNKDFPSMNKDNNNSSLELDLSSNKLNFKTLNFNNLEINKKNEKDTLNGWLILTKKNLKILNEQEKEIKEIENKKHFNLNLLKMIKNWEDFREIDKKLLGDRSFYINNKNELNQLINEENKILKEINDYNEDKKNNRILTEEQIDEFDYLP